MPTKTELNKLYAAYKLKQVTEERDDLKSRLEQTEAVFEGQRMKTTDEIMELADQWMFMRLHPSQTWSDVEIARNRLKAAIEELAKDASRYQWLCANVKEWLGWDHDFRPDKVERETDKAMKETP